MTTNNEILGGTVITQETQIAQVLSIDEEKIDSVKNEEILTNNDNSISDEISEKLKSAVEINEKLTAFLKQQKISDVEEEEELEDGDIDINAMLNDLDFIVVLKTKEPDVHFIVPQITDFENMDEELKTNISQNHFLLGFINFAINNEKWIEEYSEHVVNSVNKDFEDNLSNIGVLTDLQNLLSNITGTIDSNESSDLSDKLIDFREAVEKMNNKPKIIT